MVEERTLIHIYSGSLVIIRFWIYSRISVQPSLVVVVAGGGGCSTSPVGAGGGMMVLTTEWCVVSGNTYKMHLGESCAWHSAHMGSLKGKELPDFVYNKINYY